MSQEKNQIFSYFSDHSRLLYQYVRRRNQQLNEMDIEDVISEVMIKCVDATLRPAVLDNLPAYIYRSLSNAVIDHYRKNRLIDSLDYIQDEKNQQLISKDNVELTIEQREQAQRLFHAVAQLPPHYRQIIVATEWDGQTFKDLSERWGIPMGTLLSRKSRAINALKKILIEGERHGNNIKK